MYYFILAVMGAIILFLGWPRSQASGSRFAKTMAEERFEQLERDLLAVEGRLAKIEKELESFRTPSSGPISQKGLACYKAIQEDWYKGSSIQELCSRYNLLRGEVELILNLLGGDENESRHIYRLHSNGN